MAKTWNRLKSYEGADDPEIEGFIDKASRGSVGQEAELTVQLEALEAELSDVRRRLDERDEISEAFEDVARHLADVDIDEEVNPESLDVDDVIRIMDGDETPIRRIVAIDESEDGLIFTVRGDNLPDTEEVTEEDLAGLIVLNVPEVGDVVIWWRE